MFAFWYNVSLGAGGTYTVFVQAESQQGKDGKRDIHAEGHRHPWRDFGHQRFQHLTPFLSIRDGLEECQHRLSQ